MKNNNTVQKITEKIIELFEKVSSKDIETWIPVSGLAMNPYSEHEYRNLNQLLLSLEMQNSEYNHSLWMTFKQIKKGEGQIKKGEQSSMVTFTDTIYIDREGNKISKDQAIQQLKTKQLISSKQLYWRDVGIATKRYLKLYSVFNVAQTTNLPKDLVEYKLRKLEPAERVIEVENILETLDASIINISGNQAYYNVAKDTIRVPFAEQFESPCQYYKVLFHELIHWTGHPSRLNRIFGKSMQDEVYAFEELIAELGSTFMCAKLGLYPKLESSSAYVKSWLEQLRNDSMYVIKAVSQAERAMHFLYNFQKVSV